MIATAPALVEGAAENRLETVDERAQLGGIEASLRLELGDGIPKILHVKIVSNKRTYVKLF